MNVIVITGTPGCGKTTISRKISKRINAKCVSLNELATSERFIEGYDEDRDTYITNIKELKLYLKDIINQSSKNNEKFIIIEGHFADIVPNEYIDLVIILRCHPDILKKRLEKRNYKKKKVKENIQAEILGNSANYIFEKDLECPIYEFDTSDITVNQTLELILKVITQNKLEEKYRFGKIDWLEKLSKKNRLNEFFD
ncbi:MAG: AAA family ATPase [Promethearchaeota archaeon]|nr:MAG: AAA family ATPase [Candidatus Lokiarchaeota archaeon]